MFTKNFEKNHRNFLDLELYKVGPVDFCRNVVICIDLHDKYKGESMEIHAKSTHFDKKQLVQLCTAPNREIVDDFFQNFW
jgi:hypothetical protein